MAIPKSVLLKYCDTILTRLRERPRMYGGTWHGVEVAILDVLELREMVLSYPANPSLRLPSRWGQACGRVHRNTNGFLIDALTYDGITDNAVIHQKYVAALDDFLAHEVQVESRPA